MSLSIQPTGAACGAFVTGVDLTQDISADLAGELRAHWLEHKVLAFPDQALSDADLERFTLSFGEIGREPFFGSVDGHEHIIAIQRSADETTPVFAEFFHSDQSFMPVPPAGTCLFGITIPPVGGNTLFADQVKAYERLPDGLRERAEGLTAIHSADRVYTADGVYGDDDRTHGRSMDIIPDESARERCRHPFVRTHRETGEKALYSSPAFIRGYVDVEQDEADALMFEFYDWQTRDELVYSHKWSRNTLLMWDNRSVLHSASGGYDGHDRLLHRTTIADTRF
ncbi:MAG: TauD/TfdA family dioxygenase [Gammaproteobacteria bacterium AqS3]|nr:TauD/TfdA family dioxygenase [Gammaproteobacteria bacterium AqS3]